MPDIKSKIYPKKLYPDINVEINLAHFCLFKSPIPVFQKRKPQNIHIIVDTNNSWIENRAVVKDAGYKKILIKAIKPIKPHKRQIAVQKNKYTDMKVIRAGSFLNMYLDKNIM
ncbi:MAG: hypothetical protein AAFV71_02090 [Cyanobacteria bacterium J06633_8]